MKLDRRCFLALSIGGAAGTALTPLPWKLTDDLSIWSQNWPWTPVPDKGAITYTHSVCDLCPGGCGITVKKAGDRVIRVEGIEDYPVNQGGVCILGIAGPQLLYSPTRVQKPLKRIGNRGEGRWEPISWQDALAMVIDKLKTLRAADKSHSVAGVFGRDRGTVAQLFQRLLTVYGSPNFFSTPSYLDNYEMTLYLMHGMRASVGVDAKNADFILSFGSGMIQGWGSSVYMFKANSLLKSTGRVVQVEPRLSVSAAKADEWVAVKPGTEGALALGLAHVIINENLHNSDFVVNYSTGFETFKQLVLGKYAPETVAGITDVPAEKIVALARAFARARKPLAICGRGQGLTPGHLSDYIAVHALNALVGNINRQGGVIAIPEADDIDWPEATMDAIAVAGMQKGRIDGAGSSRYPHSRSLLNQLPEVLNTGKGDSIETLFVADVNPLYTMPDAEATRAALAQIPFIVSFASFMDETAQMADLILPNHMYLERLEDVPSPAAYPANIIGLSRPAIGPLFDTRHTGDVIIALAHALGGNIAAAFPWQDYPTCLRETLGDKWNELNRKGYWQGPEVAAPLGFGTFDTASSKFEFSNPDLNAALESQPALPQGDATTYPHLLLPYDTMRIASGPIGSPPFLVKSVDETVLQGNDVLVEVNPKTAAALQLADGKPAKLKTPKGEAKVRVHITEGVAPDVVALPRGLGHTAYDDFLAGKGVNYNALVGMTEDPVSGLDATWGIRAKLSKA